MTTPLTIELVLQIFGLLVAVVGGCAAIKAIITFITSIHDRNQKIDSFEKSIKEIKKEQCLITYCMQATLDGLHQLGANGPVTEAKGKLDKHINQQAHGVLDDAED